MEEFDLTAMIVRHPASTFFFNVAGTSMVDAGMDEGDVIVVDRSIDPYDGCKAVCFIDGGYTVKMVEITESGVRLLPMNAASQKFRPIRVEPGDRFTIWGVVTYTIKKIR